MLVAVQFCHDSGLTHLIIEGDALQVSTCCPKGLLIGVKLELSFRMPGICLMYLLFGLLYMLIGRLIMWLIGLLRTLLIWALICTNYKLSQLVTDMMSCWTSWCLNEMSYHVALKKKSWLRRVNREGGSIFSTPIRTFEQQGDSMSNTYVQNKVIWYWQLGL